MPANVNQPAEEDKDDGFIRRGQLSGIQEQPFEDALSEQSNTELIRMGQNQGNLPYGPGQAAIGNQLEVNSMGSGHNSVMNTSPVRSTSRVRGSRAKVQK